MSGSIEEEIDVNEKRLCTKCVGDEYLKAHIKKVGRKRRCSYCGEVRKSLKVTDVAELVEAVFEEHYERTATAPNSWETSLLSDRESGYDWERSGEPVTDIIAGAMSVDQEPATDIQTILAEKHSDFDADMMGEETPFAFDSHYRETKLNISEWEEAWSQLEWDLRTRARYVNPAAIERLSVLFGGLDELKSWRRGASIVVAGPKTPHPSFYRARVFQSDKELSKALVRPDLHLGPTPWRLAASGRMNARFVSVFYGATDAETALAEVRPPVGSRVLVGRFDLTRQLRLLDLSVVASAHAAGSLFDPAYSERLKRIGFLRRLSARITLPVLPDDEATDYLPTQMIAEFLANSFEPALDGILYPSSQTTTRAINVVLFNKASRVMPIKLSRKHDTEVEMGRWLDVDEFDDQISVIEVPRARNRKNPTEPEGDDGPIDKRELSLKVDLEGLRVHMVRAVTYDAPSQRVWRHRVSSERLSF